MATEAEAEGQRRVHSLLIIRHVVPTPNASPKEAAEGRPFCFFPLFIFYVNGKLQTLWRLVQIGF